MSRVNEYLAYHEASVAIGDIDPSYTMLRYVCDRFELNVEQRYWLAYLYALTYCGATVYYMYNEFPDYENVDYGRLQRWWDDRGRAASIFQTDARWRRSRNQVVDAVKSYRKLLMGSDQHSWFSRITGRYDTPERRYEAVYRATKELYTFGQFTMFLYLEALHTITPLDLCPTNLDLNEAWSCRDGLYYAYGQEQLILDEAGTRIPDGAKLYTAMIWEDLREKLNMMTVRPTVWQIETVLCAYRKYRRTLEGKAGATGKRWVGYYLDRQADEISKMEAHAPDGVAWRVLWQYRDETYDPTYLAEKHGALVRSGGVSDAWKASGLARTEQMLNG